MSESSVGSLPRSEFVANYDVDGNENVTDEEREAGAKAFARTTGVRPKSPMGIRLLPTSWRSAATSRSG